MVPEESSLLHAGLAGWLATLMTDTRQLLGQGLPSCQLERMAACPDTWKAAGCLTNPWAVKRQVEVAEGQMHSLVCKQQKKKKKIVTEISWAWCSEL